LGIGNAVFGVFVPESALQKNHPGDSSKSAGWLMNNMIGILVLHFSP